MCLDPGLAGWIQDCWPFFQVLDASHGRVTVRLEKGPMGHSGFFFSADLSKVKEAWGQGSSAKSSFQHVLPFKRG